MVRPGLLAAEDAAVGDGELVTLQLDLAAVDGAADGAALVAVDIGGVPVRFISQGTNVYRISTGIERTAAISIYIEGDVVLYTKIFNQF